MCYQIRRKTDGQYFWLHEQKYVPKCGYMSKTVTNFLIDFSTVFFWIALVGYFFFVALVVNFFHFCLLHEQHPCSCGLLICGRSLPTTHYLSKDTLSSAVFPPKFCLFLLSIFWIVSPKILSFFVVNFPLLFF